MKLGLHIGYWGLGLSSEEQLALVREAESLGYDSVWAAEAYGSDTATVLAWLAAQTEKIRIGSAIFQIPGRTPAMTAMTAATLDNISDGRMILGIGTSGPQVAEDGRGTWIRPMSKCAPGWLEIYMCTSAVTVEPELWISAVPCPIVTRGSCCEVATGTTMNAETSRRPTVRIATETLTAASTATSTL